MTTAVVVLLDIDNCLANDAWRIPYIRWDEKDPDARYHIYHALAGYDASDTAWLQDYMPDRERSLRVFVLTARPLRYRGATEAWLKARLPYPVEALLMRNNADHRPSPALKASQLRTLLTLHDVEPSDVLFAADDREDVLAAYQQIIPTMRLVQHAIHDTCAYTNPSNITAPKTVPELLRAAAGTYEERNKTYGDNYKHYGALMQALFPRGLTLSNAEDWNRLALIFACANKMSRYTWAFGAGGHQDSAHDLAVYAAMLEEMTK